MDLSACFDQARWEGIERDYMAWWAHELERPLIQVEGRELICKRYYGDAFPRWWVNFGPGIMAGYLGARVNSVPDTVWFEPAELLEAGEIAFSYQPDNPWWLRTKAMTQAAVDAWSGQIQVGHTDLGGNLDILSSFRTPEGLLYDLIDVPQEIERLVGEITQLWLRYYDELDAIIRPACRGTTPWAPIWSRDTCYMLQCDFAYMISPAMFERFIVPDLVACCEHLENGFYHLDGPGQIPHVDLLLDIPRLRGIQWIPGAGAPEPHEWLGLLKRFIDGRKLCQVFVSAEGARSIVKNLGGKGFLLAIRDEMTEEESERFLRLLASEDISGKA